MKTTEETMLRSGKDLIGYILSGTDGDLGKCRDFLFDDQKFVIRYLVADTGGWLTGRRVLVSPHSLDFPGLGAFETNIPVSLSKAQVRDCPPLEDSEPISRQYERAFAQHYGFPFYWVGDLAWGAGPIPAPVDPAHLDSEKLREIEERNHQIESTGLRSIKELFNYRIEAADGEIGHVEDFILDAESWTIRYLAVDTKNWLPGKKTLISPGWVDEICWQSSSVRIAMSRRAIEGSPAYDPKKPVNRDFEGRLYDYYGLPRYW